MITLKRPKLNTNKPQFLEANVLPSAGMNVLQIKANIPDIGIIELLHSPPLAEAENIINHKNDEFGNKAFMMGSAVLLPFANRIRGTSNSKDHTIHTVIEDQPINLPANWHGEKPRAEKHAMHGLIFNTRFTNITCNTTEQESRLSGYLAAGNFNNHWLSETDVWVEVILKNQSVDLKVTVKNVGKDILPIGIGQHPYFSIPSGQRHQARLHLPAHTRVLSNNHDDVFPTGETQSVKGTDFDFTEPKGKILDDIYLDDCFTNLQRNPAGAAVATLTDQAANYGLEIHILSPEIKAIQVYSPKNANFIAIEPQFNLADPFNKNIWEKKDTGMVLLKPYESTNWHIRLELFNLNFRKV